MDNLRLKFEEAKKVYESRELKKEELLQKISLSKKISIRTYHLKKEAFLLCEKEVDLSKLESDYYILHEENDKKFFEVETSYYKCNDELADISVINMYVLIPKNPEEETLCLFIERMSSSCITFLDSSKNHRIKIPNLFYTTQVNMGIEEYDFKKDLKCTKQWSENTTYHYFDYNKGEYKDLIEEYIKNIYLYKTFEFEISDSEDFVNYIKSTSKNKKSDNMFKLAQELQTQYKNFKCINLYCCSKFKKIEDTEIIYRVHKDEEEVLINIKNEKQEDVGYLRIKEPILYVEYSYPSGEMYIDKRYRNTLKLIEGRSFKDKLSNIFGTEFKLENNI